MKRQGLYFLVTALVWGGLAPLLRVGLVSADTLVFGELLTVTFSFGLFTLVLPLLALGMVWAWSAPKMWRSEIRWWLIPGTAFVLSLAAMFLGGARGSAFRTVWPLVATGLAVAAFSSLTARVFLAGKP